MLCGGGDDRHSGLLLASEASVSSVSAAIACSRSTPPTTLVPASNELSEQSPNDPSSGDRPPLQPQYTRIELHHIHVLLVVGQYRVEGPFVTGDASLQSRAGVCLQGFV